MPVLGRVVLILVALAVAGCGAAAGSGDRHTVTGTAAVTSGIPRAHPQVVEPTAGVETPTAANGTPIGNPNDHAPPLSEVRHELRLELIAAPKTSAGYIDPLQYVSVWERTDQGVDAGMPVGAPILAPGPVKILAIIPDWYAGQPLVYFELLNGSYAGHVQYVAEQITDIAPAGSLLQQGQAIARYARSGTGIEYGWSTPNGTTLAVATTGYEEGQVTPAGRAMRDWLNSVGAGAGNYNG
ncbi:MAG TPA: hypothetical protein VG223_06000 [Solirubrobacteraceae bacterium]|nr:hypothetical protein [Solirubrobacteraceae bacterium]